MYDFCRTDRSLTMFNNLTVLILKNIYVYLYIYVYTYTQCTISIGHDCPTKLRNPKFILYNIDSQTPPVIVT